MDKGGRDVIALGGRHLESASSSDDDDDDDDRGEEGDDGDANATRKQTTFVPAKYINSPESPIFTKKNVLFNGHNARVAIEGARRSRDESREDAGGMGTDPEATFDSSPAVVVVEGYFDAIALSNAGVENVVASMGTALPVEQLKIAAEMMGNVPNGRIVLCMDGDDAGQNAVERLCNSNVLSKVPGLTGNELFVATLPGGEGIGGNIKDPSDYIDFAGGGIKAGQRFREEVLDAALPWDEWYVDRILSKRPDDSGADDESFSAICDEASTFLARFSNPADRTRRAHKIADRLAKLIVEEDENGDDGTSSSASSLGILRVQLESDILNMSSRKASAREAVERRIEQTDGFSGEDSMASRMERLSSGDGDKGGDDDEKMSRKAILAQRGTGGNAQGRDMISKSGRAQPHPGDRPSRSLPSASRMQGRRDRLTLREEEEDHLVPHFNGFTFKHQLDRDWLGLSSSAKSKPSMHLGDTHSMVDEKDRLRAETPMFDGAKGRKRKKEELVYFNSNQFLGNQFLTSDAMYAGYQLGSDRPSPGESILEFTERKLLENADPDQLILQAECRLLHALAKFPQARATMRTVYSTSTFGPSSMRWTSDEREWLFLCLTGSSEIDPPLPLELLDGGTSSQLHTHLINRQDCPKNAFAREVVDTNHDLTSHGNDVIETTVKEPGNDVDITSTDFGANVNVMDIPGSEDEDELDSFLQSSLKAEAQVENEANDINKDGLLDEYFIATDMFPSVTNSTIAQETRAELTVQETVAILLRATAMKRFSSSKSRLTKIVIEMDRRDASGNEQDGEGTQENQVSDSILDGASPNDFDGISSDELQGLFQKVGNEVVESQRALYESERSTDRVNSHLLDYSVTNGVQYKQSQAELDRLDKMMEEHCASIPDDHHRPTTPGNDGEYEFGSDEFDGEIDPAFGGRNSSEFVVRGLPNGESSWD